MVIEIDQSGKLEQLDTDTVVAFSNDKNGTIYVKAGTKRKVVRRLRTTLIPRKELYPILFAILIYLLIDSLDEQFNIIIDEEYTGKDGVIKETLEKLLLKRFKNKWQGIIRFSQIGRHSQAHILAWKTHRQKSRVGIKRITEEEIMKLLI